MGATAALDGAGGASYCSRLVSARAADGLLLRASSCGLTKDLPVNVTIENLAPCKKLVRVEVDAAAVDAAFDEVTREFQKSAQLPGFRPGKASREQIVKAFGPKIDEEVKRKLIGANYPKALEQEKLRPATYPDIEEIQFGRGKPLQFAATVEIEPDFELPEYKGLALRLEKGAVTDADVTQAIDVLRRQRVEYRDLDRPLQTGDIAVVNYVGTCEGKPITEISPTARGLTEQKNFWVTIEAKSFIPGFGEQLVGAKTGEKRTVNVVFPADFVVPVLSGKPGVYEVEIVGLKESVLPAADEAFAKSFGAESMEKLLEGVRADLEKELKLKEARSLREQIIDGLLAKVTCELPESIVLAETRQVVYGIVQENQRRGVPKEAIETNKEHIFLAANTSAKDRVKLQFILRRIAEKEKVQIGQADLMQRIMQLAEEYQMPVDKFIQDLKKRDGVQEVQEQVMSAKVLDFIQFSAKIEEVPVSGGITPAGA